MSIKKRKREILSKLENHRPVTVESLEWISSQKLNKRDTELLLSRLDKLFDAALKIVNKS